MEIKDLPPYQPGDIVEIIKHNTNGTIKETPWDEGWVITNQTRYRVAIILGHGTSEQTGYKDFIRITNGIIGDSPEKLIKFFLDLADEIKVYPRQK